MHLLDAGLLGHSVDGVAQVEDRVFDQHQESEAKIDRVRMGSGLDRLHDHPYPGAFDTG